LKKSEKRQKNKNSAQKQGKITGNPSILITARNMQHAERTSNKERSVMEIFSETA
jgi:hypothetical protein